MNQAISPFIVRTFSSQDQPAVIDLWNKCNLLRPQNNPQKDIERKSKVNPELFLVGTLDDKIIATLMGGYDGHRGWANYLAVDPIWRKKGYAQLIMNELERKLIGLGCPKINLQVRVENKEAVAFYSKIGYKPDQVLSFGKRLIND